MSQRQPPRWSGPNRTGQTQINFLDRVGRRVLSVSRTQEITPRYLRIHLTGDDVADGFPYVHFAPTDHVKLFFPQPDTGELVLPTITEQGWRYPEGAPKAIFRDYTVRAWLPDSRELVIDFVLHEHGIAAAWARAARPGDTLGVLGPRGNIVFPENYAHYVLAGDAAAIPAISRFLEELPAGATARVLLEVAAAGERQPLAVRDGIEVTWVHADEAGDDGLERAVRALALPEGDDWFVFAAGEAGKMKGIRNWFRRELGLPAERVDVDGYWKRGIANLDHHTINLDED